MGVSRRSNRRAFLQDVGKIAGGVALAGSALPFAAAAEAAPDLAVTRGEDPKALVRRAIEMLGGMSRFVSRGDVVVIKPNIGWNRVPRLAANTNPDLVVTLIEMALAAGAKKVRVFDNPVVNARIAFEMSGIETAARAAGAEVVLPDDRFLRKVEIKGGRVLKTWPVYATVLDCDCLINVPVAKHHSVAGLTMALKNHMGVIGGEREQWHRILHPALAEFATLIRPKLTVLDAYRIMVRHGPTGGSMGDVEMARKCIAGVDQVAVDAYGASLFKLDPRRIGYLVEAGKLGVGVNDVAKLKIREEDVKS